MQAAAPPRAVFENVGKTFDGRDGRVSAVANVNFTVHAGEFVCLVGPSGCGKSTILRLLAGLVIPTSGRIVYHGTIAQPEHHNSMVFQEHGLLPWLTVEDNVAFGLETRGVPRAERRERAQTMLAQIGLHGFARSFPHELSVGMRQRAAIARALLRDPLMLLMDEPFSALDSQIRLVMQEELLRLWKNHQKMVVFVTHDIEEAVMLGDRVLVMTGRPGRVHEVVSVPLDRPRDMRDRQRPEVRELVWHIWKNIEAEVRQGLQRVP